MAHETDHQWWSARYGRQTSKRGNDSLCVSVCVCVNVCMMRVCPGLCMSVVVVVQIEDKVRFVLINSMSCIFFHSFSQPPLPPPLSHTLPLFVATKELPSLGIFPDIFLLSSSSGSANFRWINFPFCLILSCAHSFLLSSIFFSISRIRNANPNTIRKFNSRVNANKRNSNVPTWDKCENDKNMWFYCIFHKTYDSWLRQSQNHSNDRAPDEQRIIVFSVLAVADAVLFVVVAVVVVTTIRWNSNENFFTFAH